jgi:predicted dehydrogenase
LKPLPSIDFGHTPFDAAFGRRDVYGIRTDEKRAAKQRLRIGVVGCGGVAQAKWLPAIRFLQTRSEPVEIAGLVDPDVETAEKAGRLYGAPAFRSLDELVAERQLNLAMVLAPDREHASLARSGRGDSGLIENMLDAVRGLVPLGATGRDGVAAVALVAAIHESIERGEPVSPNHQPEAGELRRSKS